MTADGPTAEGKAIDARTRLRQLETWSGRATILILLGIIGDIVLPFIFSHETISIAERWSQVFFNAMIGVGLIVEYVCIVQTISATSAEQVDADQRVANAEERAAEANRIAEEARLELARLRTPRVLSQEQISALIDAARPFAVTPFDVFIQPEKESLDLATQIAEALRAAGWNWMPVISPVVLNRPNTPATGMTTWIGLAVQVHNSRIGEWQGAALAIGNALLAAGMETTVENIIDNSVRVTPLHIRVGAKP